MRKSAGGQKSVFTVFVSGKSGSGKTHLIERLIPALVRHGYRVGTIKHASHGFQLDVKGKDSWRHLQAGASAVAIASADQLALFARERKEPRLAEIAGKISDKADIILVEGYHRAQADEPSLIVSSAAGGRRAVLGVDKRRGDRRRFLPGAVDPIADWVETKYFLHTCPHDRWERRC